MRKHFVVLFLFVPAMAATMLPACGPTAGPSPANPNIILATTTSTRDSGLLDALIPAFEQQTGFTVQVVAVGTGEALKMGKQGNADVLLVHAPASEKIFMENGFGSERRLVMHNDFVLVGPDPDPAGIGTAASASDAFQRIAAARVLFISRGDDSGTHKAELKLWNMAGIVPAGQAWYLETGQGMSATLTICAEKSGYTLTDRATYLANRSNLQLEILFEGDTAFLNVYHIIVVNHDLWPATNTDGAAAFADFITSTEGQAIIASFGVEEFGQPLFFADAGKSDAELGLP